jgi:hypothetical protein
MYVFCSVLAGTVITTAGLFVVPGLPSIGTLHSYLSSYGLLLVALVVIGVHMSDYKAVIAYIVGRIAGGACGTVLEMWNSRRIYRGTGFCVTGAEINFLNAYRLHASRLGKTIDLELSPKEETDGAWKACLEDLATRYPEVVARFEIN